MPSPNPRRTTRPADPLINPNHPGGQLAANFSGDLLLTKNHGPQPIFSIVGQRHGLIGIADGLDTQYWAESFNGHDVHIVGAIIKNSGGDKIAVHGLVAEDDFGALGDRVGDLGDDMIFLFSHHHRADFCIFIVAVADGEGFGFVDEFGYEFFFDGILDIDSFGGDADLAAVSQGVVGAELGGFVQVGTFEDDHWIFGTEFEDESFESIGGGGHDVLAGVFGAGKSNQMDVASDECFALVVFAVDYLEDAFWEELVEDFDIFVGDQWRLF